MDAMKKIDESFCDFFSRCFQNEAAFCRIAKDRNGEMIRVAIWQPRVSPSAQIKKEPDKIEGFWICEKFKFRGFILEKIILTHFQHFLLKT